MYLEDVKLFDEPHSPEQCRKLFDNYEKLSKRKFFIEENMYSYFLQCKTIDDCLAGAGSVLEIGPGGNIVRDLMRGAGYEYRTLDSQETIHPDIRCDVKDFNPNDYLNAFDLVASFQMLEHIPYQAYLEVLEKIRLVSKKFILLSVPCKCRYLNFHFSSSIFYDLTINHLPSLFKKVIHRLGKFDVFLVFPFLNLPNRKYRKEFADEFPFAVHFWEVGRNRLSKSKFLGDIRRKGFRITKTFHNKIHPYHYFVLAEKD